MPQEYSSLNVGDDSPISITPLMSKVVEKIVSRKLSNFLESNSLLPPHFSYRRNLETCDALLTLSHHLLVVLDRGV